MTKRTLSDWLDYISATHPADIEMGLERVQRVYSSLNLGVGKRRVVLIAGTNGKGSTIAMIEASLQALGYRVGTYTSPHILEYNERVRIQGSPVSDQQLIDAFERVDACRADTPLTYFEFGTLAAFDILLSASLDVLLLEIGLGGRLDAVNVIEPDLSIITAIGLDHTEWLGNTLDQIGFEKAGILRPGKLFIAGETMPASVREHAQALSCPSLYCREDFDQYSSTDVALSLKHGKQRFRAFPQVRLPQNNILLALQAAAVLAELCEPGFSFDNGAYQRCVTAIESLRVPGRLERMPCAQELYIDVGHNAHAAVYLKTFLMHHATQHKTIQLVYSSLRDKDVAEIAGVLAGCSHRWLLAPLENERAMTIADLASRVTAGIDNLKTHEHNLLSSAQDVHLSCYDSVAEAITAAIAYSTVAGRKGERVLTLVFGSFYMVEAAKRFFDSYE
jgi:dihydrofolate synthase/folylpolyglutamate synthase